MKVPKEPKLREIIVRLREKAKRKVPFADAEDIVQEVLVVLVERMQRPQPIDSLQAYADGVLRHVIYDYYQRKRDTLLPNEQTVEQASPTPSPEQRVVWMRHLRVIESLAEENRIDESLIQEHFMGGAPLREVAENLNVSPGAVNGRLFRFRQKVMKYAGSCFAGLLALGTSLWSRTAKAASLPRTAKLAMAGTGLLSVGVLVTWLSAGNQPAQLAPSNFAKTASAPSTQQLPWESASLAPNRTLQNKVDKAKMAVLLQPRHTQKSSNQARPAESAFQNQIDSNKLAAVKEHQQRVAPAVRIQGVREANVAFHRQGTQIQNQRVMAANLAITGGMQPNTVAQALSPKVNAAQARRQPFVSTTGAMAASVLAAMPVALPTAVAKANTPQALPTAPTLQGKTVQQASAKVAQVAPTPVKAQPSQPAQKPQPLKPVEALALAPQAVVKPTGVASTGARLPDATQNKGPSITASIRHSFCIIQDSRIYRCDGGRMQDITGPHNEAFGCKDNNCKSLIGQGGPGLILTNDHEIFVVGPTSYMMSKDHGETWVTPTKVLTTQELFAKGKVILNQKGELWQLHNKQWVKRRSSQPNIHEVRMHLDKAEMHIEDDSGFKYKLDWPTSTTAQKKTLLGHIDKTLTTELKKQVQPHLPSIKKTQKENIPAPPQENVTPIQLEP